MLSNYWKAENFTTTKSMLKNNNPERDPHDYQECESLLSIAGIAVYCAHRAIYY